MVNVIKNEVLEKGALAKKASFKLLHKTTQQKNDALRQIAAQLTADQQIILSANKIDIQQANINGIPPHVQDRILLTEERLQSIIDSIEQCIALPDPIHTVLEDTTREDGLKITKKRVPLGVIGIIYEARPNVTVDAAILALKTNNAVILRGSSSAIESNKSIVASIQSGLEKSNFPKDAVLLIEDTSRETAKTLFTMKQYLDVLIPRGSKQLIDTVVAHSTVPVIETGAGNCHIYIDREANIEKALPIILNSKLHRPSVCNSSESLLLHEDIYANYGQQIIDALLQKQVELYGDDKVCQLSSKIIPATDDHYREEFLRLAMSVKVVPTLEDAIHHINEYSTKHSEAIVTENEAAASLFLHSIDSAAVYHNASTRFTDGFEYGYGAEIGISTQKLHARGPMGLEALTSEKYFVYGNGHIRN